MLTGKEYLESLNDGRVVFLNGEKIDDVTQHPAYRNSAQSYARMYDALHDPEKQDVLTTINEYGDRTHKFFKTPRSVEDLLGARDAIVEWSKLNFGFMGRTPDYKASFLGHLEGYSDYYVGFEDNAKAWYRKAARDLPFVNHTVINPQMDRSKSLHENKDVFVRAVKELDNGIIVSGAKMVGTAAALTNYNFVANYGPKELGNGDISHALIFLVPMNAPGLKMISRQSYELQAYTNGSPFDYPLSSRFDENDAVIVLQPPSTAGGSMSFAVKVPKMQEWPHWQRPSGWRVRAAGKLISVGRVYYLFGDKTHGQALFDRVTSGKPEASDWQRIGEVYAQAGETERAMDCFQQTLADHPKDDTGHAEIGAWYIRIGQREKGEELLAEALSRAPDEVWHYVRAAEALLDVPVGR